MNESCVLQPKDLVSQLMAWATSGYLPDVIVLGTAAHSLYRKVNSTYYEGGMHVLADAFSSWYISLVRTASGLSDAHVLKLVLSSRRLESAGELGASGTSGMILQSRCPCLVRS
jgi:hypothetical protein